jgi:hypothetical protein
MSHEIRSEKGDPANPSSQQLKTPSDPSPDSGEGVTLDDLQPEKNKEPGGREAAEARDAKKSGKSDK